MQRNSITAFRVHFQEPRRSLLSMILIRVAQTHRFMVHPPKNYVELEAFFGWSTGKDLLGTDLEDVLSQSHSKLEGASPKKEFVTSWERTRKRLLKPIVTDGRLDNHAFLFEFRPIPGRAFSADVVILGTTASGEPHITVGEVKMWDRVTRLKNGVCYLGNREERHPLEQAKLYASNIYLTHSICTQLRGSITSCSFVPLTIPKAGTGNQQLLDYPKRGSPNFLTVKELIDFHLSHAPNRHDVDHLKVLKTRKLHTAPSLAGFALLPFTGSSGIALSTEQENAADAIIKACKTKAGKKRVIIVNGGPGTGKSVVALKVFGEMMKANIGAFRYLTNSANFRDFLKGMLFTYIHSHPSLGSSPDDSRVDYLVEKFTAVWQGKKRDEYKLLIADEAQSLELRHRDGPMYKQSLTPPVIDIIQQAQVSAFFLDSRQAKKRNMIGTVEHIKTAAQLLGAEVLEFELHKQFRCGERDEVVEIVEEIFGHRQKPSPVKAIDISPFKIKVFDCVHDMEAELVKLPKVDSKRIIAGFAWPWKRKEQSNPNHFDVSFNCRCGKRFERSWNVAHGSDAIDPRNANGYIHATKTDFQEDVLSIHTTQGVEYDHVGLILGNDASLDSAGEIKCVHLKGTDHNVDETAIANNYRTIATRSRTSLFIYAVDSSVSNQINGYLNQRMK